MRKENLSEAIELDQEIDRLGNLLYSYDEDNESQIVTVGVGYYNDNDDLYYKYVNIPVTDQQQIIDIVRQRKLELEKRFKEL